MKSLVQAAVIAAVFSVPALSFAQSANNAPITRAQVKAELVQFEQANPRANAGIDPYYPASTQATEARIAAQNNETSAYGGAAAGSSAAGSATRTAAPSRPANPVNDIYFGH
ncbi:DUF4148 domain-containing protein [Trinickia caryophylli]|uniref:DUF4148 domain-containing protein n=1 Tax=Trinickia caryophylli TaxID=28094 RepID=A0A1X7FRI2_TRICW|nr:DUF4148 domain-containing protein [Trinickia caryophylli]PMS11995.1 DUF4148 domain-containing protein [Trinickia caryophylli]TRX13926.1 DUF4148 domain-containing protein [Trinickia caryophylli]WQE15522.1 DUF4148 domain-containing protein [Trinickia caryophylli]SMF57356.1 protein of unknown function [Trinickia caryophylli]GLU33730.1 hypothetical protein Busp01_35720 [Trinickia caryophylli]